MGGRFKPKSVAGMVRNTLPRQNISHQFSFQNKYIALGKTDLERFLFVVFTIRADRIRIISAGDMSKKERKQN